jgi:hypothetical protein
VTVEPPLSLVNAAPHDGAIGIDPTTKPTLCFSEVMDAAGASGLLVLTDDQGAAVGGQAIESTGDASCLSMSHDKLKDEAVYTVRAKKGLKSAKGKALAVDLSTRFKTSAASP